MKSRKNTLQNKQAANPYGGGLDVFLFSPMREHGDDPAIKRVDEILSLLVAAEGYRRDKLAEIDHFKLQPTGGIPEFLDQFERSKQSERAYYQTLEVLNIKLSRYRWEASLSGNIDGFRNEIVPAHSKNKWGYSGRGDRWDATELWKYSEYTKEFVAERDRLLTEVEEVRPAKKAESSWEYMEPFMIASLLKAVNSGEISRYRRCFECHHWFYAARGHQHFCENACRRKHEAQSPAFKKKRAKYMREKYRPNEKRKDALGKRQAARVLSEQGKSRKGGK